MSKKSLFLPPIQMTKQWVVVETIAKRIREGYEVLIVVMTDGKYAFSKVLGINSDPSPEELKEIRRDEKSSKNLRCTRREYNLLRF